MLLIAATLLISCSMPATGPGRVDPRELVSTAGRLIDENIGLVREAISADIPDTEELMELTGYDVASRALEESGGEEYLEFCIGTNDFRSVDEQPVGDAGRTGEGDGRIGGVDIIYAQRRCRGTCGNGDLRYRCRIRGVCRCIPRVQGRRQNNAIRL